MASAEERREAANERAKKARKSAEIAQAGYDKDTYAAKRRESLAAGNEAMELNEGIKAAFGPNVGTAKNQLRSNKARSQRALDEASRILAGGSQRSDKWQE